MFASIENAPPDPIFALISEFNRDPRPGKINLTIGVFQDETGHCPILQSVQAAERRLLETETSKSYLGIAGHEQFNELNRSLVLGEGCDAIAENRARCIQTPGGTGALRVTGDFIANSCAGSRIWCSDPTWSNHLAIFRAAGLVVERYPYLNADGTAFDFAAVIDQISRIPENDAILFHTCCHNPSGFDADQGQWDEILKIVQQRQLIPVFDFAYQGFFQSVFTDAWPVLRCVELGLTTFVCNSLSKSMGLYAERIGGLNIICENEATCQAVHSQCASHCRSIYSNPPQHGALIASTVLSDPELKQEWISEVDGMRNRLNWLRAQFVDQLSLAIPEKDFSFIGKQNGMFSFTGISGDQADRLKQEHAVYLLKNGRVNIAGINESNLDRLCEAIAKVTKVAVAK